MESLIEQILNTITESNKPMSSGEIAVALKMRGKPGKRLYQTLNRLVSSGQIVRARKDKYILAEPADLVTGTLDVLRSGNAFVVPAAGGGDVFITSTNQSTALPGDRVVARIIPDQKGRGVENRSGKVIKILERKRHDIVGTLRSTGKFLHVVPVEPSYSQNFYVPDGKGAKIGDRVVIRFSEWMNRHVSPEAEVIDIIGPEDNPSFDTQSIVRHYGFRTEFPVKVLKEAETVSALLNEHGERLDLRDKFIITVDPDTARDFDDALSLENDEDGNRILGIHIADVSHFVRKGSALDDEARARGTSVYLPDMVIPMLPEQLSNGVCSLKPDEDRFAFSVFLTVDSSSNVIKSTFAKSVIRSKVRLTYRQALALLQGKKDASVKVKGTAKLLGDINTLAQQFRKQRFARYALELDVPECEIVLDENGGMTGIRLVENDISHQMIEEAMVAANEAVAKHCSEMGVPIISRFHDKPQPEKIEDLQIQLQIMGFKPGDLSKSRNLSDFLKKTEGHPLSHTVRVAVLRSMQRAIYSAESRGHYGLAKAHYSHFTSPIRRYPDLVLHRQLCDLVTSNKKTTYRKDHLVLIAQNCSTSEQAADQAERSIQEIKKYRYLQQQLEKKNPEPYDAVITKVSNIGMFIEIIDLQVQGLVHISNISKKFVSFNQEKRLLREGKTTYRQGDKLKVHIAAVDFDKRRLDFAIA